MPAAGLLLALGVALVLVLFGRAVLAVPDAIRTQDARLSRADLAGAAPVASPGLFAGTAESFLGAADDQGYREALRLFYASRDARLAPKEVLALHGEAEARLGRIVRTGGDPALRSRAANLLGVLLFDDARLDPSSTGRYLELSFGALKDAVRLDPGYAEAKRNLELVATLPLETAFRNRQERGSEASATPPEEAGY
jgi:hypothetical protein